MKESTKIVKDNIVRALLKLMKKTPIDKISICAIIDQAMVSRNSFYRHFVDKDDILRYYISSETENWLRDTNMTYSKFGSTHDYLIFLLEHLYKYRNVIEMMMCDNKMYLLEEEFDKRFKAALSGISDPWHIAFTIGGFYKLFCYWAETGYEKTPQEIAEYVME